MKMIKLLIAICVLYSSHAFGLTCGAVLKSKPVKVYSAEHFAQSKMWYGNVNNEFADWAADYTNMSVSKIKSAESLDAVLSFIAMGRKDFELSFVTYFNRILPRKEAGVLREKEGPPYHTDIWTFHDGERFKPRLAIKKFVLENIPDLMSFPYYASPEDYYRSLEGYSFPMSQFFYLPGEKLEIMHPNGMTAAMMLEDSLKRAEIFLKDRNLMEFMIAMQDYFNAMPYKAGSASIGRVFFSALFYSVYGKTINIDPDIDVIAMTLSRDAFIQFVAKSLVNKNK